MEKTEDYREKKLYRDKAAQKKLTRLINNDLNVRIIGAKRICGDRCFHVIIGRLAVIIKVQGT
jgi:hypothetical protein